MLGRLLAITTLLVALNSALAVVPRPNPISNPVAPSPGTAQIAKTEARHTRKVFYVGGDYNRTASGTYLYNQIYVEQLTPAGGVTQSKPLVLLHGGELSGTLWLNKPDGGQGWASFWLDRGYQVYIVDEWSTGRSDSRANPSRGSVASVENTQQAFTAPERYKKYYQAKFHTQWPGNGSLGDPIFDDFYSKFGPITIGAEAETIMRRAMCDLLQITGPAVLIAVAIGSEYALQATDACPQNVAAHVSIEGDQTPFASYDRGSTGSNTSIPYRPYGLSNIPLTFDPPVTSADQLRKETVGTNSYRDGLLSNFSCILQASPARQLPNIAKAPMLFVQSEASIHATYDHCQVAFLQQAGVRVDYRKLADEGIRGNGQFMMLEKNSDQIALWITRWIEQNVQ